MKKIDGKRIAFGSAPAKRDRRAYRQALDNYRQFMREREQQQLHDRRVQRKQQQFRRNGRDPRYAAWALAIDDQHVEAEKQRRLAVIEEAEQLQGLNGNGQQPKLADLVDEFLAEQQRRHEISIKQPEALPAKRRLGVSAMKSIRDQLGKFKESVGDTKLNASNAVAFEQTLRRYRAMLDEAVANGHLSPATVSNRVRGLKRFVHWLWERRYLQNLPRGLDEICAKYSSEKKAKALTVKELHPLLKHADPRLQAIILLSLNTGMYFSEIAQLRGRDLKNGYVARRRSKTGVPSKHKLWGVTQRLVKKARDNTGEDELLFVTRQGYR